jgi:CRISPR-associated endonuclease Csn1
MDSYTLGLDIGSNSIGWALLDVGERPTIVGMGVRVFPEGVNKEKGQEKSKNATRREARGARRTHQRRNLRRDQLVKTLKKAGLLPEGNKELAELLSNKDPYELRKKGLDEKLDLYDFGRALFHINQRRGFKSNRKSDKKKEDGPIAKGAGELQKRINDAKCRTLGEYFAGLNPEEQRIREKYTFRSMYEEEFDLLWAKQSKFYPKVLTEELQEKVRDKIIFFQRPMRWDPKTIGDCVLELGEKRCPRGDWYAKRFRILQDVNNLKICNPDGTVDSLTEEQRQILLDELSKKKEVKFTSLRKRLGLLESQKFNAEYEVDEKGKKNEKLKGDVFCASMRSKKIFGSKVWDGMDEEEKIKLNEWLVEFEDDQIGEKLRSEYNFNDKQIESVLKISLPQGYMSFSRKAIQKLLPLMEEGKRTDEALDKVYPERNEYDEVEETNKLQLPKDLRNPLVNRAMFEVRKVVNAIVREYGKPAKIKIEMARDVRGTTRERRKSHFKMLDNERRNEQTRKRLIEDMKIVSPTRDDIIKYNLWIECGKICPYTGKSISQAALFGPNPEFQVEHILPYDRTLDDSFMNKTLCEVHENKDVKRNQTPFEAYGHDEEKFEQLKQRVNRTKMPYWKKQKFWQKEIDTDNIISRELNDTRYINREVVKYLKQICSNTSGTKGKITSELGYQWGFIKDRNDHRHHAIDAAVIAVTQPEHLRQLGKSKYSKGTISFQPPWPHFREELSERVKHINVSHKPSRKVSGALHEETNYGLTGLKDKKGQDIFVYRKKLEDLTNQMIIKIVDPVVREIVIGRLAEYGIDLAKDKKIPPKDVWSKPLYMKNTRSDKKVPIKKVRIRKVLSNAEGIRNQEGKVYRYVNPGRNHHVEIWEYTEGKKEGKRDAEVVSMFEAVRRSQSGKPVVQRNHGPGTRFVCSLAINDMVMMKNKTGEMDLYRVQKMDANKMVRFRHHTASTIDRKETYIDKTAHLFEGHKVTVDPLGRVWRAND